MRGGRISHVCLAGICLTSLLVLLAFVVTACAASSGETTSSFPVPVSASDDGPDWIGGTTSTGNGPADLYCSVRFAASQPEGAVYVSLRNEAGELIDSRSGMPYDFKGLETGKYRLGVFGGPTGYVSQWYGGLPVQGHDVSESQVLELKPGRNVVEFVLQPGLSIQGEVSWTQGTRLGGDIQAYDLQHRDTLRGATLRGITTVEGAQPLQAGIGYPFLIVGLLPGSYRLGVSFDAAFVPPQFWDGGGSFEDAPVIGLTSGDVADVRVELGALPTTTTTTTSPQ
jgi:hypothetical protein